MSRDLSILLLAIYKQAEGRNGQNEQEVYWFRHELEITTETHVIKMPIEAQIATADEFRKMFRGNLEAGKSKNARILSVRPGSTKQVLSRNII